VKHYRIPELAEVLRISKSKCYKMAAAGELPITRIGSRVIVSERDLQKWLAKRRRLSA